MDWGWVAVIFCLGISLFTMFIGDEESDDSCLTYGFLMLFLTILLTISLLFHFMIPSWIWALILLLFSGVAFFYAIVDGGELGAIFGVLTFIFACAYSLYYYWGHFNLLEAGIIIAGIILGLFHFFFSVDESSLVGILSSSYLIIIFGYWAYCLDNDSQTVNLVPSRLIWLLLSYVAFSYYASIFEDKTEVNFVFASIILLCTGPFAIHQYWGDPLLPTWIALVLGMGWTILWLLISLYSLVEHSSFSLFLGSIAYIIALSLLALNQGAGFTIQLFIIISVGSVIMFFIGLIESSVKSQEEILLFNLVCTIPVFTISAVKISDVYWGHPDFSVNAAAGIGLFFVFLVLTFGIIKVLSRSSYSRAYTPSYPSYNPPPPQQPETHSETDLVRCPSCQLKVRRSDLEFHQKNLCPYRIQEKKAEFTNCPICGVKIKKENLANHLLYKCRKRYIAKDGSASKPLSKEDGYNRLLNEFNNYLDELSGDDIDEGRRAFIIAMIIGLNEEIQNNSDIPETKKQTCALETERVR